MESEKELYQYLLDRAYHILSIRPRSEKELTQRLKNLAQKKSHIDSGNVLLRIVDKLKQENLLGDEAFALWLVESRMRRSPRGKKLLQEELLHFGVDSETISKTLKRTFGKETEIRQAYELALKKFPLWNSLSPRDLRVKSVQFLQRKGFPFAIARQAVDEILAKKYNKG